MRTLIRSAWAAMFFALALVPAADSQIIPFHAAMDGQQTVPPSGSPAIGTGEFDFNATSRKLTFRVDTTCVAPQPFLTLGIAAPGQFAGPHFFIYVGTGFGAPDMWEGAAGQLNDQQVAALFAGEVYVQISGTFGGPDIRGQLVVNQRTPATATLTGAISGSAGTGSASLLIETPEFGVLVDVQTNVAATMIELRSGAPLSPGSSLIADFQPIAGAAGGHVFLGPAHVAQLLAGDAHVLVRTAAHPTGELAGPLVVDTTRDLGCRLTGDGMVPAVPTGAHGVARAQLDESTGVLTYDVWSANVAATAAHLCSGAITQPSAPVATLAGGGGHWSGQLSLGAAELELLRTHRLHFRVDSAAHPNGELRGPLLVNPLVYGYGSSSGAAQNRIGYAGRHVLGAADWQVSRFGGTPNGSGMLVVGFANATWNGFPLPHDLMLGTGVSRSYLWLDATNLLFFPAVADANGVSRVPLSIPAQPLLLGFEVYYQWVVNSGVAAPYSVSDALRGSLQFP